MNKNLLVFVCIITSMISCNSDKEGVMPNKALFGRWYYKEQPLTLIDIEGTNYSEYLGEINSEVTGKIHWIDSLNFELEITNVKGEISRSVSMRPGRCFQVRIEEITPTRMRLSTNNKTSVFNRE